MSASSQTAPFTARRQALARFAANRSAVVGLGLLALIALLAILIPILWPHGLEEAGLEHASQPPSLADFHWFGTDANGRDLFVRVFYGARISLAIGLIATAIALAIGVVWGAVAGWFGGLTDLLMMRFVDVLYAVPLLFLVIVLVTVLGNNVFLIFAAIGAVEWLTMARIVRGQTIAIRNREYIDSARAVDLPTPRILSRYVIPNVIGPVIVYSTLLIPVNIIVESSLSFLGLGVQEPLTSWGLLINQGAPQLDSAPWILAAPATLLAITMLAFNAVGDGLRDALDPQGR
ncbi:MAG: ABC transporter permease [Novosphingobium sp.]